MPWDRLSPAGLRSTQERGLRAQLTHAVGPFSPYWRARFEALGIPPRAIRTVADLGRLPAVGERDVCVNGDPAAMAGLVLQVSERGYAVHASGGAVRRALLRRLRSPQDYALVVESDTRPTTFVEAGLGLRYPLASTRGDLDLIARAGARLWQVLGVGRDAALVSAVPVAASVEHLALWVGALGAGLPALFPGPEPARVAEAL